MASFDFEVNDKIELNIAEGPYRGNFPSKIQGIDSETLEIIPPYEKGELLPVRKDTKVKVLFTRDDAAYKFFSRVEDRIIRQIPLLVITYPEDIVRIQRRDFFRLEVKKQVKYRLLDSSGEGKGDYNKTVTSDISAGGLKMVIEQDLPQGSELELYLNIKPVKEIPLKGKVVQKYTMSDGKTKAAGIEFMNISSGLRDKIISWMFDYQRKLRQKGLL
ncbi:MAG: flagellar brake protein [Halanaerobiaceae bacterium]